MEQANHRILELQAAYMAIRNKKSHVLQLPEEITRIIFLYTQKYREQNTPLFESLSESGLLLEVVVSHVCREWRLISLAYPLLWTRFLYDGYKATRVPLDRFEAVDHSEVDCEDQLDLLEIAIGNVQRWKSITVISDNDTPLFSAPSMLEWASVPDLECFAFCTNIHEDPTGYADSLEPTIFKNGAPKLNFVMLDTSTGQGFHPPLHNITALYLEFPDDGMDPAEVDEPFPWSTFVEVLSLPSLIKLSITGEIFEEPDSFISMEPTMNNLKHLRCSETDSALPFLLPFLKAPSLETLIIKSESLENLGDGQPEPLGLPSLKSLSLVEAPISLLAAQYLAGMTASVTDITVIDKHIEHYDESLFPVFLCSNGECWTNLKDVTLDLDIGRRLNDVIGFAQTRRDSHLVLHVPEHIVSQWLSILFLGQPHAYAELARLCHIETTDNSRIISPAWQEFWPSDEDEDDDDKDDSGHNDVDKASDI